MADMLYIAVPCYNEEAVLPKTAQRLQSKMTVLQKAGTVHEKSRILFVNDGSRDKTWGIITQLHTASPIFPGVNLTRNRGHQTALLGFGIFIISLLALFYAGLESILCSVRMVGGLLLLAIGIVSEYIGKIYLEGKERPDF